MVKAKKVCFRFTFHILTLSGSKRDAGCKPLRLPAPGPHKVKITLTNGSPVISGSTKVYPNQDEPIPVQERHLKNTRITGNRSDLNEDKCFYQPVTKGSKGFSLRRFLPADTSGDVLKVKFLHTNQKRQISQPDENNRYEYMIQYRNQSVDSTGGSTVSERRLRKWS